MQPENSQTQQIQGGAEQLPSPVVSTAEHMPTLPAPEVGVQPGLERGEQHAEAQAAHADAASVAALAIPVVPTPVVTADDAVLTTPSATTGPMVAAHEDVIEKEWVDKAKKIITTTKDDPFKRGQQVGELQKDYLKKRYGKDLGASV